MRRYQKLLLGIVIALFVMGTANRSMAEENIRHNTENGEVVFLLDASGSMNTQDKNRLAIDAIRQAAYSLPSNYRIGLVVYNTEIQAIKSLDTGIQQLEGQLGAVSYSGYTNAGQGLSQAVGLFSETKNVHRYIIMLSDGEIDMPDKEQREASRTMYVQSAEWARDKGIKICIIAVGSELNDPRMHIFDGAELTDGAIYWEGQSGSLTQIMERIITDKLSFPRQAAGVTDANGGNVHIEVPKGADYLKLLITSEAGLQNVRADYGSESGQTIAGQKFAVVEMKRPVSGSVDFYFETPDISGVQAHVLTEFKAEPQLTVHYRSEELPRTEAEIKKDVPPSYEHWADITIGLMDMEGKKENLWEQERYEGFEIPYTLNDVSLKGTVENGLIKTTIPADGVEAVRVSVNTQDMDGIYYINQPAEAQIEKYPDPVFEPSPDYRPLIAILSALVLALVFILILWIKKKNTTVIYMAQPPTAREPAKKMGTKSCTYTGKFNMYVIQTADGQDVPPQSYRLFGRNSGRITLNQILTSCKIKFGKIGADDIIFYPGPEHSVIIMDQSERCTALRGTEILKKGVGYPVFYGEKVTITFEDEATEMEIHYKDLKPSEREGI